MLTHAKDLCSRYLSTHARPLSRASILYFTLVLVVSAILSGCTGITSAKPSSTTSTTDTSASAVIGASPTALDFGNVNVGSASNQSLTIANFGTSAVTISQAAASGAGLTVGGVALPVILNPGNSVTFTASFAPSTTGDVTGTISFTSQELRQTFGVGWHGTGKAVAALISVQPASQSVLAGQTATFSVTANGTPPITYQWYKNGTAIGSATSASYSTPAEATSDNGAQFMVVVSNGAGSANSSIAMLSVTTSSVAPSITSQPGNQTIFAGQTATFSVVANGTLPLSYQWRKNGAAISGATSSTYTTPTETTSDNGALFSVMVSNSAGNVTSNNATLTVNPDPTAPSITSQPPSLTITAGQTATFTVVASGTAPLSYQWNKNGAAISGATSASYTTPAETTADNGAQFTVVVSNSAGSATSNSAILTVNAGTVAPTVTTQPSSQTITAGQTATFSVTATGTAPLSYQWQKNGAAISGAASASYTTPSETTADTGAQFRVVVSNSAGNATSNSATLTVNAGTVAPTVTTQPASQTITAGQTATFSVTATGTAPLSYQWQKNGAAISGATSASYTTPAETTADTGAQFTVVVSNSAGNATSNSAILTVNSGVTAPSITTQPANKTIVAGLTATFSVVASGTAPLSYQWQKNGAAISGATSASYTTPAETTADSGAQLTVVVSNSAGNATSNAATLTVNANTYLLSAGVPSLDFGNITLGTGGSTLPVTISNLGNSNVTVSTVTVTGAGFSASGISAGQIITPGNPGTLNVTFAPSATGAVTGSVVISSNATNSPVTITLAGIGVQISSGANPPALFFTDLANGPATGNSDSTHVTNGGAYVTLYGNFLGSTQGSSTVTLNGASCLQVVSWGQSWLWYQKIVVQLTAGCSSGNFVVSTSNGSSNGVPFTVASGSIYYVSTTGNDSGNGSFATPFRTFLHGVNTAGAGAGNIVYVENGYTDTAIDPRGWGTAVWNPDVDNCHGTQNAMNGVVAYPGASVTIGSATGSLQTIRSVDNGSTQICPGYWTVAGMKFISGTDNVVITGDALSNTHAQYWRWIANDVSNPNSNSGEGANWETSQVWFESVYGNYFHDMNLGTTSNLSQGVYPSSDTDHFDMGWNLVFNGKGRATIQIHSSPLNGTSNGFGLYDLKIHDNMVHGSSEECILVDTTNPANGPVLVYNNVIWGCGQDLVASNGDNLALHGSGDFTQSQGTGYSYWVEFYNNTIYCTDGNSCAASSYTDNNRNNAPALSQHNELLLSFCTGSCVTSYASVPYFMVSNGNWGASGSFYCNNTDTFSTCPWAQGTNNLIFGNGGPTYPNLYSLTLNLNPNLVNPGGADFHLQTGSPAIGAGVASWSFPATGAMHAESGTAPKYDIDGRIRPNPPSVGAYE